MTRALTLTQPWASAVAQGAKSIETRSWSTRYRGPLLIHAAATWSGHDQRWAEALARRDVIRIPAGGLPRGVVVARVRLEDVVPTEDIVALEPVERMLGDYSPGRFGWFMTLLETYAEPIPARGALGLWAGPDL